MNLDNEVKLEGGLVNNPFDKGGITKFGITKPTLAWFRKVDVRTITDDDIRNLTSSDAEVIFEAKFVKGPGFDIIPDSVLKSNLVDFAILSGPSIAILNLQDVLGVEGDGKIGPKTTAALSKASLPDINIQIVKKRLAMVCRLVEKDPSQRQFLAGWVNRIIGFLP